jgi:hypothetical protein
MSGAGPLPGRTLPPGGLSVDVSPCLRTGERLAKRPGMQARPWPARSATGAA